MRIGPGQVLRRQSGGDRRRSISAFHFAWQHQTGIGKIANSSRSAQGKRRALPIPQLIPGAGQPRTRNRLRKSEQREPGAPK